MGMPLMSTKSALCMCAREGQFCTLSNDGHARHESPAYTWTTNVPGVEIKPGTTSAQLGNLDYYGSTEWRRRNQATMADEGDHV